MDKYDACKLLVTSGFYLQETKCGRLVQQLRNNQVFICFIIYLMDFEHDATEQLVQATLTSTLKLNLHKALSLNLILMVTLT